MYNHKMEKILQMFISLILLSYLVSADKIIGVVEVCRHGARSPNNILAFNKENWTIEAAITPVGMR